VRNLDYPERELVRKSRDGDIYAFEELIKSYEKRIFNIAFRMTGNREDASDTAQEACIKIFKSLDKFKENSSFSTWVYRITSNVCIDEIRKRKNNVIPLIVESQDGDYEMPVEDKSQRPDEIIENKEMSMLIKKCINELIPEHRIIIIFRDIYGYTYEEISETLSISMGTVKSRLNRARNMLRSILKNTEHFKSGAV
jgi:RNA polymerase sigma-70 factor, ECF subfamily